MNSQTLQTICNVIILIGAVAAGINATLLLLSKIFGKPIGFFRKRRATIEKQRRQEIIEEVSTSVTKEIIPKLDEIHQQNLEQNQDIETLTHAMRNSIGAEIMAFYEQHKVTRVVTETEKDAIIELYKSYKSVKGNHYIDNIYDRMTHWTVVTEEGIEVKDPIWWKPTN